jgi:hypothetical protein
MATATEAPVGTKSESEVEADQALMRRHLRRRTGCEWKSDPVTEGEFMLGDWVWTVEMKWSEKKGKHCIAFSLYLPEHNIDRRFECWSYSPYTAIKEAILIHSSLRLAQSLDLMSDDF